MARSIMRGDTVAAGGSRPAAAPMERPMAQADTADKPVEIKTDETPDTRIRGLVRLLLIVFVGAALVLNMNKVGFCIVDGREWG